MAAVASIIAARASGVYRTQTLPRLEQAARVARDNKLRFFVVDCQGVADKPAFLRAVARSLDFPAYFGDNWDALEDSLTDLEWITGSGVVIYLTNLDEFAACADFETALEIFAAAAQYWKEAGRPFICFIQMPS